MADLKSVSAASRFVGSSAPAGALTTANPSATPAAATNRTEGIVQNLESAGGFGRLSGLIDAAAGALGVARGLGAPGRRALADAEGGAATDACADVDKTGGEGATDAVRASAPEFWSEACVATDDAASSPDAVSF